MGMGENARANVFGYLGKFDANALHATEPKEGDISKEVEKHEYITPVYLYHIKTTYEAYEDKLKILEKNKKKIFSNSIDQFIGRSFRNSSTGPFNKNFDNNFPFLVKLMNKEKYVLSLKPLETINNPDGTSITLDYIKTLLFEPLYDNDQKLKTLKFKGFLEKDPSSYSHFKKRALPKKRASQKKKKASPKKRASPKAKKRASPKKKSS
jgi:hypothetical protein